MVHNRVGFGLLPVIYSPLKEVIITSDIPTLKKYVSSRIGAVTLVEGLKDHKVVIVTAAGVITGSLNDAVDKEPKDDAAIFPIFEKLAESYREENSLGKDTPLAGSDGFLLIRDVSIRNGNSVISMPSLAVFFDQIIGITIGKDA